MPSSLQSIQLTPDLLRCVPILAKLPDAKLQWMIDQGQLIQLQPSELLRAEGEPATCVFVLLEGSLRLTQRVGNQDILLKQHELPTLFGEVPLLMGVPYFWASGRAITTCRVLELSAETFWQFMGLCPTVAMTVLRTMIERVQEVQILAQHREKMISLGTLAAGLAHELNNPASAARRAARELRQAFPVLQTHTLKLSQHPMSEAQRDFLTSLQQEVIRCAQTTPALDPIRQSDREDQLTEWMEQHQISHGWQFAAAFVTAGLDEPWLNQIAQQIESPCLPAILVWLDATLTVVGLLQTLGHSTERIHQLVEAVQDYSSIALEDGQAIDIHEGLENTLTLLQHKLKRSITIVRDYGEGIPSVLSRGHELEQVWMNLMDNAIDAVGDRFNQSGALSSTSSSPPPTVVPTRSLVIPTGWQGTAPQAQFSEQQPTIHIRTRCEANWVLVEIRDNGVGIPADVQPRIFEPFFTTKGVGRGTGLGLNTSYKIVERHNGDIRVVSRPGDTCFQVRLPSQC